MKAGSFFSVFAIVFALALPGTSRAEDGPASPPTVTNLQEFIRDLNLNPLYQKRATRALKIAILDNGFDGYEGAVGKTLPSNTQFHAGPIAPPAGYKDQHGLVMSEILYGLLTNQGKLTDLQHEFHLYRTYGYSNLKAAIDDVIARKVDLVLYAQNWEYGGNIDGKGFINTMVNSAIDAGITWVNSTGDFGETTYRSSITRGTDDWVKLPGPNQSVEIRCEQNDLGKCPLRLVLSWNDFKDDVNVGTAKDLDLVLTDDTLSVVQTSTLVQSTQSVDDRPGYSLYPREVLGADLKPGTYYIRVKMRTQNFTSTDRLWITASGTHLTMPSHSVDESLAVPADNARVIAVGASDTGMSSRSRQLGKPDLIAKSLIKLSNKDTYQGTSSASAAVAAVIALLKTIDPSLSRDALVSRARAQFSGQQQTPSYPGDSRTPNTGNDGTVDASGLTLDALQFYPTGLGGCFVQADPDQLVIPATIRTVLAQGGTLVVSSMGYKILFDFDPISLLPGVTRRAPNDMLIVGPGGPGIYIRSMQGRLPRDFVEVAQLPAGEQICD